MSIAPDQDATTGAPPAGWYADPSGAGQRWWDGGRWTEHVMPAVTAPVAAPAPVEAPVHVTTAAAWTPGPSNPLGEDRYAELGLAAGAGQQRASSASLSPSSYVDPGTSMPSYGTGAAVPTAFPYPYLPGVPAPKNTKATVGFILGIVFVTVGVMFGYWFGSLLAVIVSIAGLRRARTLAAQGYPAVGRGLAIWGIVLSALSWAVAVVLRFMTF